MIFLVCLLLCIIIVVLVMIKDILKSLHREFHLIECILYRQTRKIDDRGDK